jgi:Fe-S oxidoreductase
LGAAETCCGAPLHEAGFATDAAAKREGLDEAIRHHGTAALAVLAVECLEALNDRPAGAGQGARPAARHPVLLLRDAMLAGTVSLAPRSDRPPPALVASLDPCHVTKKNHGAARAGDPAAAARAVLIAAGSAVVDSAAASPFALCCGAAGAMPVMNPEAATRMATGRIAALAETGATAIVTISPLCLGHLRAAERDDRAPAIWGFFEFLRAHFDVTVTAAGAPS